MTKEQLDALEAWIVAIIRDEDRASALQETRDRINARLDVLVAFELMEDI